MTSQTPQPEATDDSQAGFLELMRHRNYALLWSSQLVSQIGDRFHWVAISLWVYAKTGSALSVSYAIIALMIAPAIVGFYAGTLVDRLDRRRILIAADITRAGLVALIPWLMDHGMAWVYLALFLVSAASAFFRPAMFAVIPQSVPKRRLLQANAFFASMDSATEVFGPALAGVLVAALGYAAALYVDSLTYLGSACFVAAMRLPCSPAASTAAGGARPRGGAVGAIKEGLSYIKGDRIQVALLAFLLGGFWVAGLNSLQTPLAKGVLGVTDQQFGWFQSVWGLGFIGSSLLLGWRGGRIPRGQAIVFAYTLWALATGAMGLSPNYVVLLVTGFWVGFANMLLFVNVSTLVMEHTPTDKVGRVITTRQVLVALMRVAALLGFGKLADAAGIRVAIVAMASISLLGTTLAARFFPVLWRYRAVEPKRRVDIQAVLAGSGSFPSLGADRSLLPALSSIWAVLRSTVSAVDPEFEASEQRWLNKATLLIVGVGWFALFMQAPTQALGLAATVAVAVIVAKVVKEVAGRLRASDEGKERGR